MGSTTALSSEQAAAAPLEVFRLQVDQTNYQNGRGFASHDLPAQLIYRDRRRTQVLRSFRISWLAGRGRYICMQLYSFRKRNYALLDMGILLKRKCVQHGPNSARAANLA